MLCAQRERTATLITIGNKISRPIAFGYSSESFWQQSFQSQLTVNEPINCIPCYRCLVPISRHSYRDHPALLFDTWAVMRNWISTFAAYSIVKAAKDNETKHSSRNSRKERHFGDYYLVKVG